MLRKVFGILLVMSVMAFGECDIPELKKFESKTEPNLLFSTNKGAVTIDVKRLMRKTIMVESDCRPDISHPVAKGITQIEAETFNEVIKDKEFKSTFNSIEKKYDVNLKKNWANDTYTNIVAAYALYRWKMVTVPRWWDIRYNFTQLKSNYKDKEWNLYKIYFNSIAGKTTLQRWDRYKV
ncbi:MAG: hypothetical protein ACRCZ9_04005 [Fusobacteriaceae bacterium]